MTSDSTREFLEALAAEGVDRALLERTVRLVPHAAPFGMRLIEDGSATLAQVMAAQRRWARQQAEHAPTPNMLGRYVIERQLGEGAAGVVYLVRDPASGVKFAAKRLNELGDAEDLLRFRHEAEVLASLKHPNLIRVHSADFTEQPFFVLDYCAGGTLAARLDSGPLPSTEAAALLGKLARALATAHAAGVVHRDLKPENVLFDDTGEPQLTDFGLALALTARANRLTQSGTILGTPSYMAPEQVTDPRAADARSDVYGLGAVLYACLTGKPPFRGGSLFATLQQVVSAKPSPPSAHCAVDPHLERVCLRALEKNPAHRFASALDFAAALEQPAPTGLRPALFAAFAALVALLALGWVASAKNRPQPLAPNPIAHVAGSTPEPSTNPVSQAQRALLAKDWKTAWEQIRELNSTEPARLQLALELLRGEAEPEVFADAHAWWNFSRLQAACTSLNARSNEGLADFAGKGPEEAERLLTLMQRVAARDDEPEIADQLLASAYDAWFGAWRSIHAVEQAHPSAPDLLPLTPHRFPITHSVQQTIGPMLGSHDSRAGEEARRAATRRARETIQSLGERVLSWPLTLAGEALALGGNEPVLETLTLIWGERVLVSKQPPLRTGQLVRVARILANHSLFQAQADRPPLLEVAALMVRVMEYARSYDPFRASDTQLEDGEARVATSVALARGDLAAAEAYLRSYAHKPATKVLLAGTHIERARRLEPNERQNRLKEADGLLAQLPQHRGIAVMRHHIRVLAEGSGYAPPSLPPWEEQPEVHNSAVPSWYHAYGPTWRFPSERDPQRTALWLPPINR